MILEIAALFCGGAFFGAALYISLGQHPAALAAGGAVAGSFFPPMYRRAAPLQISLALVGFIAGALVWLMGAGVLWLVGALSLASVIPITLLFIKPINDALLSPAAKPESKQTARLLAQWGARHWWRTVVSGASFLLYLTAAVGT